MKKLLIICITLLALLGWYAAPVMAGEGVKMLRLSETATVEVPEMAPDFTKFQGQLLGSEQFPNGNMIAGAFAVNADQSVQVVLLFVSVKGKLSLVGMIVKYVRSGKTDVIEDVAFMKTGLPSGKLSRVEKPTNMALIIGHVSKIDI